MLLLISMTLITLVTSTIRNRYWWVSISITFSNSASKEESQSHKKHPLKTSEGKSKNQLFLHKTTDRSMIWICWKISMPRKPLFSRKPPELPSTWTASSVWTPTGSAFPKKRPTSSTIRSTTWWKLQWTVKPIIINLKFLEQEYQEYLKWKESQK